MHEWQSAPLSEALDPPCVASSSVYRGEDSLGYGQPVGREPHSITHQAVPIGAPEVSPTRGRTEIKQKTNKQRQKETITDGEERKNISHTTEKSSSKKEERGNSAFFYVY